MTFLQPFILWGLPLVLAPVIIHLINRLRHRTQPWAAMRFLLSATRSSINQAKLRQFLILLFRVLAVAALVLFLARPLAGGWLGWMVAAAPDTIVILLDRSASMGTQVAGAGLTAREHAVQLLARAAKEFEETSHLVLVDSALRTPQELANANSLTNVSLTTATDTAADIPAMFGSAVKWLVENRAGTAEIWVASDLQRSNWQPEDARWKSVMAQINALPQTVRVRVLAAPSSTEPNTSISLKEVQRRDRAGRAELHLTADLQRNASAAPRIPLDLILDGARSQVEVQMESEALRWRYKFDLGQKTESGWGSLQLAADANRHDNMTYFVYGPPVALKAGVVSADAANRRFLQLASVGSAERGREPAEQLSVGQLDLGALDNKALLVWQAPLPSSAAAERVRKFIEEGGMAVFFPPGQPDAGRFAGVGWGEVQAIEAGQSYRIVRWDEEQGPLAKTDEGFSLPLGQTGFQQRQVIVGGKSVLAAFQDGVPFLARASIGRGEVYFVGSLPAPSWSSLGDGPVLVPMLQRLLQAGGQRLQKAGAIACGELSSVDAVQTWAALDTRLPKDIRFHAGVYQAGERLLAVNRPVAEDDPETVEQEKLSGIFGGVTFQLFQDERSRNDALQGEFWRIFLFAMLMFLLVEAWLILPARSAVREAPAVTQAGGQAVAAGGASRL